MHGLPTMVERILSGRFSPLTAPLTSVFGPLRAVFCSAHMICPLVRPADEKPQNLPVITAMPVTKFRVVQKRYLLVNNDTGRMTVCPSEA